VTGETGGVPPGCDPRVVAARLVHLFDAINRGDPDIVDEYFGRSRNVPFMWYSTTEPGPAGTVNFASYTWGELADYLDARYRQGEQLHLLSVQFNGWDAGRGLAHFGPILVTRRAADLSPGPGGYCRRQGRVSLRQPVGRGAESRHAVVIA
jgi:hypothetical protein